MISVIIPLYNKEKQIANAIDSVLKQSYQDFEIVVVNDGSTDKSVDEVRNIKDNRIRLYEQSNAGVSAARNHGISEAKGEFVAFLDADDEWLPTYLAAQFRLTQQYPECSVYAVNYDFLEKGEIKHTVFHKLTIEGQDGVLKNYFEVASCSNPPLWTSAVMVRTSAMLAIGGFPIGIAKGEDLLTWAKLAVNYQIAFSKDVVAIYNLGENHGFNAKPVNIPQGNQVGEKLEKLIGNSPELDKMLALYIGRWYKSRASIFLRGGERYNALINIFRAISYYPSEWKIYVYLFMLLLPNSWVLYLFKKL